VSMLCIPIQYLASTEVLSDSCALVWDRQAMRKFVSRYPGLLDNALSIAAIENFAWLLSAYVSLSSNDAGGRVAHLLVSLACGVGKVVPDGIELRARNEDLAAGANVMPFTVSRTLNEWQRAGILTKDRSKVVSRNLNLLTASAATTLNSPKPALEQRSKVSIPEKLQIRIREGPGTLLC